MYIWSRFQSLLAIGNDGRIVGRFLFYKLLKKFPDACIVLDNENCLTGQTLRSWGNNLSWHDVLLS